MGRYKPDTKDTPGAPPRSTTTTSTSQQGGQFSSGGTQTTKYGTQYDSGRTDILKKGPTSTTFGDIEELLGGRVDTKEDARKRSGFERDITSEFMDQLNMAPEDLASLRGLIGELQGGGTKTQREARQASKGSEALINQLLNMVSPDKAKADAGDLMALNLQQAMERNMPAIAKSAQGAGTSASSMQGLLSQNLARDAALASGALGAQQAKAYAAERTGLAALLSQITSSREANDPVTKALINALNIAKGAVVSGKNVKETMKDFSEEDITRSIFTQGEQRNRKTQGPTVVTYGDEVSVTGPSTRRQDPTVVETSPTSTIFGPSSTTSTVRDDFAPSVSSSGRNKPKEEEMTSWAGPDAPYSKNAPDYWGGW